MRKGLGYLILSGGGMGLVVCVLALFFGFNWIDRARIDLEDTLLLVGNTLDTAGATLEFAGSTTISIAKAFDRVERTLLAVSKGLDATTPIVKSVRQVTADTIPRSLDLAITAVDGVADAARALDDTLNRLSDIEIELPIIGTVNLSLTTAPETPLYEPVDAISASLQTVSERLSTLDTAINTTQTRIRDISASLTGMAGASQDIRVELEAVGPLVDSYVEIVGALQDRVEQADISEQVATMQLVLVVLVVWVGLSQLTALVVGWTMIQPRGEGML